jgi:hypothetical protein
MKKTFLISLLAAGLAASAFAQVAPMNSLILGIRDDGSAGGIGTTTYTMINLGLASSYTSSSSAFLNISSYLATNYGAGWATDTGLKWGIIGGDNTIGDPTYHYVYASANAAAPGTATAWLDKTTSTQGTVTSKASTIYNALTPTTLQTVQSSVWSTQEGTNTVAFGQYLKTTFEQSGAGYVDLFQMAPTASSNVSGVLLGSFQLSSSGDLSFVAVPEPATYAALLGLATLGVVLIRRRRQVAIEA